MREVYKNISLVRLSRLENTPKMYKWRLTLEFENPSRKVLYFLVNLIKRVRKAKGQV